MKTLSTKLLAITCIFALVTGCASVTDHGLAEQPDQPVIEQVTPPQPDDIDKPEFGGGDDMEVVGDEKIP